MLRRAREIGWNVTWANISNFGIVTCCPEKSGRKNHSFLIVSPKNWKGILHGLSLQWSVTCKISPGGNFIPWLIYWWLSRFGWRTISDGLIRARHSHVSITLGKYLESCLVGNRTAITKRVWNERHVMKTMFKPWLPQKVC